MPTKQLDKGQIAEVFDLYDGTRASVVELSKLFNVKFCVIDYFVNHRGHRDAILKANREWQKNNPEKKKEYDKRASKKYHSSGKYRIYVEKNRDKINARAREYCKKNRDKINARAKEYYQKNKNQIRKHKQAYYKRRGKALRQARRKLKRSKKK